MGSAAKVAIALVELELTRAKTFFTGLMDGFSSIAEGAWNDIADFTTRIWFGMISEMAKGLAEFQSSFSLMLNDLRSGTADLFDRASVGLAKQFVDLKYAMGLGSGDKEDEKRTIDRTAEYLKGKREQVFAQESQASEQHRQEVIADADRFAERSGRPKEEPAVEPFSDAWGKSIRDEAAKIRGASELAEAQRKYQEAIAEAGRKSASNAMLPGARGTPAFEGVDTMGLSKTSTSGTFTGAALWGFGSGSPVVSRLDAIAANTAKTARAIERAGENGNWDQ
jgi:hypothetical protein